MKRAANRGRSLAPFGEREVRGLPDKERLKPLTPPLSLWEREQTREGGDP